MQKPKTGEIKKGKATAHGVIIEHAYVANAEGAWEKIAVISLPSSTPNLFDIVEAK